MTIFPITTFPVMVGLVPTIHVFPSRAVFKTWMLATRASMTQQEHLA